MISKEQFATLLASEEGPTLDFKRQQYGLLGESKDEETTKLIKDVIAFSNTVRSSSGYIIIGVDDNPQGKNLLGLDLFIDDSVFQDKLKDKVSPKPCFRYYSIEHDGKRFGVLEFPIYKYSKPLESLINGKGLEKGKAYFRRGSINSECSIDEIIQISDWLKTIKINLSSSERNQRTTALMAKINSKESSLSACFAECLGLAKEINDSELESFCKGELQGWNSLPNFDPSQIEHRSVMAYISWHRITKAPYKGYTVENLFADLEKQEGFFKQKVNFPESISTIEELISKNIGREDTQLAVRTVKAKDYYKYVESDGEMYVYTHPHQFKEIHQKTKQLLINELLKRTI